MSNLKQGIECQEVLQPQPLTVSYKGTPWWPFSKLRGLFQQLPGSGLPVEAHSSGTSVQSCCGHQQVRGQSVSQLNYPRGETVPYPRRSTNSKGFCLGINGKDVTPGPLHVAGNPGLGHNHPAAEPLHPRRVPSMPNKAH